MRCTYCGYRLVLGANIPEDTLVKIFDECYYAVSEEGNLLSFGEWCAPDSHVIRYDAEDIRAAAREIARFL